jgi:hypothetical protein
MKGKLLKLLLAAGVSLAGLWPVPLAHAAANGCVYY